MKKVLFIAIIFLGLTNLNAQKARFGIKGGLNVANLDYSGSSVSPTLKSNISFNAGILVEIMVAKKVAIQPELFYSAQGTNFEYQVISNGAVINTNNTINLNYINLPVMLKFYAAPKFNLEFGPQVSFLTDASLVTKALGQSITQDGKKLFTNNDFGLNFGASFEFTKDFFFNFRYYQGLTNISKTQPGDDSTFKNNVLSFGLGYKFK